jgi:hypothetical protein
VWWTTNGIGALVLDPNLTTSHVNGAGDLFGVTIIVNGWHALFHLVPGLAGIASSRRPGPALAFTLTAGAVYIVAGGWGLLAGGDSIGIIAVDASGDLIHVFEGALTRTPDLASGSGRRRHIADGPQRRARISASRPCASARSPAATA